MKSQHRENRSGNVIVLTAFLMIVLLGFLAFAVDLGYIQIANTQLQRCADSAATAGAWELLDQIAAGNTTAEQVSQLTTATTAQYATLNQVAQADPQLAVDDVAIGHLDNPSNQDEEMSYANPTNYNVVQVRVQRTTDQNQAVPLFFARLLGTHDAALQKTATAAFLNNFSGFQTPTSGGNLGILPFALDLETWDELMAGNASDSWTWNEETEQIQSGSDGVLEVNLFPQGTGSPGNRGTVDIGNTNNSTNDIRRQILYGVSAEDLEHHGGELVFDENGELSLNGDTGLSAGVKAQLEQIKGEPRTIPLFTSVSGPGNNAWYTIVAFAGVRIMEVKLTGNMNSKRVIIQPAKVVMSGGIPGGETQTSYGVYSPVWLVR